MGKPEVGEKVRVQCGAYDDCPWVFAEVTDLFSTQFMAVTVDMFGQGAGREVFGMYNAEGERWKRGH